MASTNVQKFLILLHRLLDEYVTLIDIYRTAINPALLQERLKAGARKYQLVEYIEVSPEVWAAHAARLSSHKFRQTSDGGPYRAETTFELIDVLKKHAIPHNPVTLRANATEYAQIAAEDFAEHADARGPLRSRFGERLLPRRRHRRVVETLKSLRVSFETVAVDAGGVDAERQDQMEAVLRWFRGDWTQIDVKLRTSIVERISVFLSLFDTNPKVKRIFCPPKETFDPARNRREDGYPLGEPFPPFADLVEEGRVVGLNSRSPRPDRRQDDGTSNSTTSAPSSCGSPGWPPRPRRRTSDRPSSSATSTRTSRRSERPARGTRTSSRSPASRSASPSSPPSPSSR
jgi:hypothetical protein